MRIHVLTIGCETLDRDYADYHKYKKYLEQLGVRTGNVYRIRFKRQAGAYVISGVPVYDSPVIITDRSLLKLK